MNSKTNKPVHVRPTRKKTSDDGCGGCGKSIKRNDPRRLKSARRTIKKKF